MIHRGTSNIIVDQTGDAGDSAHFNGLWVLFEGPDAVDLGMFVNQQGECVRNPYQFPWDNKNNFTPDQMKPLVAGLKTQEKYDVVRKIFWSRARCLFFCQDSERDFPGSTKYPWPHKFLNDKGQVERRSFDFRTPLFPDSIFHIILCGRIWWLYWFGIIGYPWLFVSLIVHCTFNTDDDDWALVSQCKVAGRGWIWLYKKARIVWQYKLYNRWVNKRNMVEMYMLIKQGLEQNRGYS